MRKLAVSMAGLMVLVLTLSVQAQAPRQVWAFYMGFWAGGASWDMQSDVLLDHPALGNYDSRDGGVAGTQIDQAKSAGIDAFVVSWYGLEDGGTTTPVLNNMLDRAAERGFQVGAVVDIFSSQFNRSRDALVNSLAWLVNDRANHPAYLRYDGKPVILFAFQDRAGFSSAQWQEIRNAVDPNRNTLWIAEGVSGCCLYGGAMDGMYAFNIAWANGSGSRYTRERSAVTRAGGSLYIPTVHPGWDETLIAAREGRGNPTAVKGRANGQFLTNSFNGASSSGANVILIGTWNEFIENSHIEPSNNYGSQSLDTLRPLIDAWKNGAPAPAGGNSAPAGAVRPESPTGQILQANSDLNVRPSASTDGAPLGKIRPGTYYAILSTEGDWIQIDFNGQPGWVNARFVTVENR